MSAVHVDLLPRQREGEELRPVVLEAAEYFAGREVKLRESSQTAHLDLAHEVLAWATQTFGPRLAVTSSMTDGVVAHLAGQHLPGIDVLFLDTGYHFAQTLQTRDQVARRLPVNVRSIEPELSVGEQDEEFGKDLFNRDPTACCRMRKVEPLAKALEPYEAWVAGLRRDESVTRAGTGVVEWDEKRQMAKINPLATWTQAEVDAYIDEHDVPVNMLLEQGYPSIGCFPCTRRPKPGEDARDGRWAGFEKTECGING